MKKNKKPLTINVVQDDRHVVLSPKHANYKQIKQRHVLTYNQHTITSSINNQEQYVQYDDRQQTLCEQFVQFHHKDISHPKKIEQEQPKNGDNQNFKVQKYKKFNVIQFQQFKIEGEDHKSETTIQRYVNGLSSTQNVSIRNQRKQFTIQIPRNEQKDQRQQVSVKMALDIKKQNTNKGSRDVNIKQPLAPSNKTKMAKSLNSHFVFPTNDQGDLSGAVEEKQKQSKKYKQGQIVSEKYIGQEEYKNLVMKIESEWQGKIQGINKSFEKERQQFYKEKSNLDKDLMIKDGQIQMLQKLITIRYSPKEGDIQKNHSTNRQSISTQQAQSSKKYANSNKPKASAIISDQRINSMETILLQKDLQINTLLERVNQLNILVDNKGAQIEEVRISLMKAHRLSQSLKNQIFLYQKKEQSQKLTNKFYKAQESLIQAQQASKTPKGYFKQKWPQDFSTQKDKEESADKSENPLRGIDDLHRRLESLKMNRIQLQNRGKIKSQISYSKTSKNKTKGTFDFKGKFYERDYINHSRMY